MEFTVSQIAGLLNGEIIGESERKVTTLAKIEEGFEGALSFLSNPSYTHYIYSSKASAVIVNMDFIPEHEISTTLIKVDDARLAFAKLLEMYNSFRFAYKGIEQPSFISSDVVVDETCYVGAFAYIGKNVRIGKNVKIYPNVYLAENVVIGNNTTLYSGVRIYHDCIIGNHCTIHSGVILGGDGFGFAPNSENAYAKVTHIGNVILEDHVEIGSNTTIDRATMGSTIIKKGVKLDNLIQIAHNVEIGENTVIAAQTGVAGSTKIGSNCLIGGQVGIVGHITIANGVKIAAQSGIGQSILNENEIVQGSPAFGIGEYKRSYVMFKKLPEFSTRISEIEKKLK
jgi:UDP-3-O-[3-hydroxymyristoyl] glucosamine N-acyltransferase